MELIINEVILSNLEKKKQILHGGRAFNLQSPLYLRKQTSDYDILTNKPKKSAKEIVDELSRRTGKKISAERILPLLGSEFRKSKVSSSLIVEKKEKRLTKGISGTGKQIQYFR